VTIPAAFEVRLGTYGIDEATLAGRAQVWALLEPHVEQLLSDSLRRSAKHAPVLTATITANFDRIVASRIQHLANLFLRPLDERWVADAYSAAEFEARIGLDGRSRVVNARSLLSSFAYLATAKHRFAPVKAARLIDVATRMLMLDGANGAACHKELEVEADATEGQELVKAVEDYASTVKGSARHNSTATSGARAMAFAGKNSQLDLGRGSNSCCCSSDGCRRQPTPYHRCAYSLN
jgi:hypothetical protein